MSRLATFRSLRRDRRHALLEAALLLALAWLLVRCLPFRFWSRWLGAPVPGEVEPMTIDDRRVVDIRWAILTLNRNAHERFTCLMQAMAAQWMLNRRRVASSLVLGARCVSDCGNRSSMEAHAWVKVGPRILLGEHGGQYTAVSSFVTEFDAEQVKAS